MKAWLKVGTPQFEQAKLKDGDTVELWREGWKEKKIGVLGTSGWSYQLVPSVHYIENETYEEERIEDGDFIKLIDLGEGLPNVEGGK